MDLVLLLLLSILPGFIIVLYIYWRDRHDSEPLWYLSWCFAFGMLSTYPAVQMETFGMRDLGIYGTVNDPFMTFTFAFAVIALSEEFVKYLFLRYYIFPKKVFDEPMDGIVYAVMVGMGFATLENILYVVIRPQDMATAFHIGWLRMTTAVPGHAIFAIIMGYFVGWAKFAPRYQALFLWIGLLGAVVAHGIYDYLIFMRMQEYLILLVLLLGTFISLFLLRKHSRYSLYGDKNSVEIDLENFEK
ncbi:MAG: PrsW family intramembrane metalloprotease [Aureispira sp.]